MGSVGDPNGEHNQCARKTDPRDCRNRTVDPPEMVAREDRDVCAVEAGQRLAVGGEMEERVAGQHLLAAGHQPVVQLPLLLVNCNVAAACLPILLLL